MRLADSAVAWLLASRDPTVRYVALTEVLGRSPRSRAASAARAAISRSARAKRLLAGQRADGGFGRDRHPYKKWSGAHWRLYALAEIEHPPGDPRVAAALANDLAWLNGPARLGRVPVVRGRVRMCAGIEGNALRAACRLGFARADGVEALARRLVGWQWPDGGWNCDVRPAASHASFHETLWTGWGLSEYARVTGDRDAGDAARRVAELLLAHRLFRSHRTGDIADRDWLRLRFPAYWHYNALDALRFLDAAGMLRDPRARDALDWLASKRDEAGKFRVQKRHWKSPGTTGPAAAVVDWGTTGPHPLLTARALGVLARAGRAR